MAKALKGELSESDWGKLWKAQKKLADCQIYVDDSSLNKPSQILAKCRKLKREKGTIALCTPPYGERMLEVKEAEKLCKVRVIDYNSSEKVYDNSIFYAAYVRGLSTMMGLPDSAREQLVVYVNLLMQTLDEEGLSPYRTFDGISKFSELLSESKDGAFSPRISDYKITDNTKITLIEPPCGSNVIVLQSDGELLFIDCGYACYEKEMLSILQSLFPDFENTEKRILVTHADVDHCGLLPLFDEVIASSKTASCLKNEFEGKNGYREQNALHKPYIRICKMLTSYKPVAPEKITVPWENKEVLTEPLTQIGFFDFGELHFEVYEGKGGHLPGEIVLIDYLHHIAFTGDIFINVHGLTPQQARYNQYAPILMTSVDTDPRLCAEERHAILQRLGVGTWKIFGSHGCPKEYSVTV